MYIFFTDESKTQGEEGKVYDLSVYGGLVLDKEQTQELTNYIYDLKDSYLYPQTLELKWRFKTVWDKMKKVGFISEEITAKDKPESYESFKNDYETLKNKILDKVANSSVKIVVAIRPNRLLHASEEQDIEYSVGAITKKFRKILVDHDKCGIILADELRKKLRDSDIINYEYILNSCSSNRQNLDGGKLLLVVPTIDSCISPIHQINDILLGVIQYYILEFMRKLNDDDWDMSNARNMLNKIVDKFYKSRSGGYIINNGILLYPPKITRKETQAGIFLNKLERQLKTDFNIK
ncbi:MAG: hypothetical protein PHH83_02165 [Patescibacteria group bacterium]|nr:hypothetical protein [Patescibacteria group bacterium]